MGAKLTNTRTGDSVNMVPSGQTPPTLKAAVGDTIKLEYTVSNISQVQGTVRLIWQIQGDSIVVGEHTLNAGQSASNSATRVMTDTNLGQTFATHLLARNASTGQTTYVVQAYIQLLSQQQAEFRIDDVVGALAILGIPAVIIGSLVFLGSKRKGGVGGVGIGIGGGVGVGGGGRRGSR